MDSFAESFAARRGRSRENCQLACKPGSVWLRFPGTWQPFIWDSVCTLPHATHPDDWPGNRLWPRLRVTRVIPIRSCSRWGLPCRPCCQRRGGLLPHPFTLTSRARRFAFCGTFPEVAPAGRYPAPCFRGARTFLPRERERPSGRLARGRCALARPASSEDQLRAAIVRTLAQ